MSKEIRGGAKIKEFFEQLYVEYARNFQATKDYTDNDIEKAIQLHEGDQLPGFPSVDVFHYLMRPKLELLNDPANDCLSDCHLYIESLAEEICDKVFMRFPSARSEIMEIVSKTLYDQMERTKKVVDAIVEAENGYQFTNDKYYLETRTEIVPAEDAQRQNPANPHAQNPHGQAPPPGPQSKQSRRKIYVDEIRKRIDEYFIIVIRNIRDSIPKAVGFFLVQGIQEKIQFELYAAVNKNEEMSAGLGEPAEITAERSTLKDSISTMKKSLKVLQRDPEITATLSYDDELSRDIKDSLMQEKRAAEFKKHGNKQRPQQPGGNPAMGGGQPKPQPTPEQRAQMEQQRAQQARNAGGGGQGNHPHPLQSRPQAR